MPKPDVDYDGTLAVGYERGRSISAEALATWRDAVGPLLPASGFIADVGAGTGRYARPLAELAPNRVLAIEPAAGMRSAAKLAADSATARSIRWLGGAAEALPLPGNSIDVIWSAFTTHYFDLPAAGAEFARVLRPGGRALIWHAFPDVLDDLEWMNWFPAAREVDRPRMPEATTVQAAFESQGLSYIRRDDYQMWIAADLAALADRMANRSISSLQLISDVDFGQGLARMRAAAERGMKNHSIYAPNVMLTFAKPSEATRPTRR